MPSYAAILGRIGASLDDSVDGAALMLAQHGFLRLAVLDVEQNPVLEGAEEIGAFEERLHREARASALPAPSACRSRAISRMVRAIFRLLRGPDG
jgi:hypothetical protein